MLGYYFVLFNAAARKMNGSPEQLIQALIHFSNPFSQTWSSQFCWDSWSQGDFLELSSCGCQLSPNVLSNIISLFRLGHLARVDWLTCGFSGVPRCGEKNSLFLFVPVITIIIKQLFDKKSDNYEPLFLFDFDLKSFKWSILSSSDPEFSKPSIISSDSS